MRKMASLFVFIIGFCIQARAEYIDHRGHNVDSLEAVMARWTASDMAAASEDELKAVASDIEELMLGFNQTNSVKSEYYARMLLSLARRFGWDHYEQLAAKCIGQHFWAKEKFDSAAFYYGICMKAAERISETGNERTADDVLSQMYGTLGNLYSEMDSIDVAMAYYEKAGVLFKKHDWHNSSSVLYYNMGETMRDAGELDRAEDYYKESLIYSKLANDSLAIATAYKGLGALYLDKGKTARALRFLADANDYYADHEDEELYARMESLDYTGQVLALQKKRLKIIMLLLVLAIIAIVASFWMSVRLKRVTKEKDEIEQVLEETVEDIGTKKSDIVLKPKEREVLELIAKGYTNIQIADAMCLSPETIKWYKKKLFTMFEASNSAELVKIANDEGILS